MRGASRHGTTGTGARQSRGDGTCGDILTITTEAGRGYGLEDKAVTVGLDLTTLIQVVHYHVLS